MTSTADLISYALNDNRLSAPETTHALKELGEGLGMKEGIRRMIEYFAEETELASINGRKTGRLQGLIVGFSIGFIAFLITERCKENVSKTCHEEEGKEILKTLTKDGLTETEDNQSKEDYKQGS